VVLRTVRVAFALICVQLVIAAGMVEMHLPPAMRSLHEADGIAIWLTLFALAWLARYSDAGREQYPACGGVLDLKTPPGASPAPGAVS
jgi:heme A synthase